MRLAWQPIFEREWEQNSERFQIGKSLHLKEKRHFCKQALDNPSHGSGIEKNIIVGVADQPPGRTVPDRCVSPHQSSPVPSDSFMITLGGLNTGQEIAVGIV